MDYSAEIKDIFTGEDLTPDRLMMMLLFAIYQKEGEKGAVNILAMLTTFFCNEVGIEELESVIEDKDGNDAWKFTCNRLFESIAPDNKEGFH